MGNLYRRLMLKNSVVNTETCGCDFIDTSVPLLTTAVAATHKLRYIVNGLTGVCDNIDMFDRVSFITQIVMLLSHKVRLLYKTHKVQKYEECNFV